MEIKLFNCTDRSKKWKIKLYYYFVLQKLRKLPQMAENDTPALRSDGSFKEADEMEWDHDKPSPKIPQAPLPEPKQFEFVPFDAAALANGTAKSTAKRPGGAVNAPAGKKARATISVKGTVPATGRKPKVPATQRLLFQKTPAAAGSSAASTSGGAPSTRDSDVNNTVGQPGSSPEDPSVDNPKDQVPDISQALDISDVLAAAWKMKKKGDTFADVYTIFEELDDGTHQCKVCV